MMAFLVSYYLQEIMWKLQSSLAQSNQNNSNGQLYIQLPKVSNSDQ